jgi:ketosteroid isomerase-like protein
MRVFSEDAVLMPHHGGEPVVGAAAIRKHFWPAEGPAVTVGRYRMEPAEVGGCGALAYSRGKFAIEFSVGSGRGAQTYSNAGTYLMIFRRYRDGEWRIMHYIWDDPPPRLD